MSAIRDNEVTDYESEVDNTEGWVDEWLKSSRKALEDLDNTHLLFADKGKLIINVT
jgi:hypothetical protein